MQNKIKHEVACRYPGRRIDVTTNPLPEGVRVDVHIHGVGGVMFMVQPTTNLDDVWAEAEPKFDAQMERLLTRELAAVG